MKQTLILLFLSAMSILNAQNRYYPSLSTLVQMEDQTSIPNQLKYVKKWYDNSVEDIFYKDFQMSNSSRNDASFKSLGLILRGKKVFDFGKNGLRLSFDVDTKKIDPVRIINNHNWPCLTYGIDIIWDKYDPEDNFYHFLVLRKLESLSENQVIANFINRFTEPEKGQASLERFILDLNSSNDINILYDKDMNLTDVSKAIKEQMAQGSNFYWAPYNTYIQTDSHEETRDNISTFFRSLNPTDIRSTINERFLPYGDISFDGNKTILTLPEKYFKYNKDSKGKPVRFYVQKIEYDINYDYQNKNYDLSIKVYPKENEVLKDEIQLKAKAIDIFKNDKEIVRKTQIKSQDIEYIEINFKPNSYSLTFWSEEIGSTKFYKEFKIK